MTKNSSIMYDDIVQKDYYSFENPKKETLLAIGVLIGIELIFIFFFMLRGITTISTYTLEDVIWRWCLMGLFWILPVLVFLYLRQNSLKTVYLQRKGLDVGIIVALYLITLQMLGLGLIFSSLFGLAVLFGWFIQIKFKLDFNHSSKFTKVRKILNLPFVKMILGIIPIIGILLYAFSGGTFCTGEPIQSVSFVFGVLTLLAIATGEEIFQRGLMQMRAVEWLGEKKGILLVAVISTLVHFPMLLFTDNSILVLVFIFFYCFLEGYLVNKTKNLSVSIITHTFFDLF
ncbi:MAG: lysostaphin resistance A-like protein [Candidatus Hermodarchaeota archaeon]